VTTSGFRKINAMMSALHAVEVEVGVFIEIVRKCDEMVDTIHTFLAVKRESV